MTDTLEVTGPMAILMAMIDESDDSLTLDSFTEDAQEAIQKMKEDGLFNAPAFTLADYLFTAMGCAVMGWVGKMIYDTFGEGY